MLAKPEYPFGLRLASFLRMLLMAVEEGRFGRSLIFSLNLRSLRETGMSKNHKICLSRPTFPWKVSRCRFLMCS